jgi:hypothetical protein
MKTAGLLLCISLAPAWGQGTTYSSRSEFNAALNGATTIDFETVAPTDIFGVGTSPITVSGVTFADYDRQLFISSGSYMDTGHYLFNFDSGYPVSIFLPSRKNAFGADFSGGIGQNPLFDASLTFTLLGGQTLSYNFAGTQNAWTFFGVAFAQPITNVIYDDGGRPSPYGSHEEALDNVTFGSVVPEPTGLFLVPFCWLLFRQFGRKELMALGQTPEFPVFRNA